ncbi:endonuclease/exonuclease/phosphatase family protein [Martelella sp. HB161492]|uniref:endonuclease/exonuclease/phosphatase family protein n=1 Tax=Martelella sp. HB161492 TaxID=2720726 RepID=UPI0015913A2C|nr:endonuclease/exonuclease/phosphatase family protein [Martelella sp. HB161492]
MKAISTLLSAAALSAIVLCIIPIFSSSWFFSFIGGMRLHLAVFAILVSLLLVLTGQWPYSLLPLVASLAMLIYLNLISARVEQPATIAAAPHKLKVIEFNIFNANTNGAEISAFLRSAQADVAFILESDAVAARIPELAETYPYRLGCGEKTKTCDLMILSRHPLLEGKVRSVGGIRDHRYMQAKIDLGGGSSVSVVALHLTKPYYDDAHAEELRDAAQLVSTIEGPLILAGDFNSSILAGDVQTFLKQLGLHTAAHEPRTWPISAPSLGLAIDHILVRPPAHIDSIHRIEDNFGSNHYGLMADISVESQKPGGN